MSSLARLSFAARSEGKEAAIDSLFRMPVTCPKIGRRVHSARLSNRFGALLASVSLRSFVLPNRLDQMTVSVRFDGVFHWRRCLGDDR